MGCPGVAKVLVWGDPLACRAHNKFFRAEMESIYGFEKGLYLNHFLTQPAENWYVIIIFDCLPEFVKKFDKFKISYNELVSTWENTYLVIKKVTHPEFKKFYVWVVDLGSGNTMLKDFEWDFIIVDLAAKKPFFFPPKLTFEFFDFKYLLKSIKNSVFQCNFQL